MGKKKEWPRQLAQLMAWCRVWIDGLYRELLATTEEFIYFIYISSHMHSVCIIGRKLVQIKLGRGRALHYLLHIINIFRPRLDPRR